MSALLDYDGLAQRYEMQLQGRCDRTIFWGFVPKKGTNF